MMTRRQRVEKPSQNAFQCIPIQKEEMFRKRSFLAFLGRPYTWPNVSRLGPHPLPSGTKDEADTAKARLLTRQGVTFSYFTLDPGGSRTFPGWARNLSVPRRNHPLGLFLSSSFRLEVQTAAGCGAPSRWFVISQATSWHVVKLPRDLGRMGICSEALSECVVHGQ
jgi:hypothetical protein